MGDEATLPWSLDRAGAIQDPFEPAADQKRSVKLTAPPFVGDNTRPGEVPYGQDPHSQMSSLVPQSADGGSNLSGKRKTADGKVRTANRAGRC